jgi:hypothetical protein
LIYWKGNLMLNFYKSDNMFEGVYYNKPSQVFANVLNF